jgi:hypothetical protein
MGAHEQFRLSFPDMGLSSDLHTSQNHLQGTYQFKDENNIFDASISD